jgi:hypothetical protein
MQIKWSARMTRDIFSRAMNLAFVAFVLQRGSCPAGGLWALSLTGPPTNPLGGLDPMVSDSAVLAVLGRFAPGTPHEARGRQVPESCQS